jgi:putative flippase GtrA
MRFLMVGTVGFLVDGAILQTLVSLAGWNPVPARLVSFSIAVVVTWLLNRHFTFKAAESAKAAPVRSVLRYMVVSIAGAGINVGTFTALVLLSALMAAHPIIPLAVGSVVALMFNYLGSKHFAFRPV